MNCVKNIIWSLLVDILRDKHNSRFFVKKCDLGNINFEESNFLQYLFKIIYKNSTGVKASD